MLYTPVSCRTGHSFRGTRSTLYTPVSWRTGHFFRGTSIEMERLLMLCLGQEVEKCSKSSEAEWQNEGIFDGGRPKVPVEQREG